MVDKKLLEEENKRLRRLQLMVNLTIQLLAQTDDLTLPRALEYIKTAKEFALTLFPDKEAQFDLIYKPRFTRILIERGLLKVNSN